MSVLLRVRQLDHRITDAEPQVPDSRRRAAAARRRAPSLGTRPKPAGHGVQCLRVTTRVQARPAGPLATPGDSEHHEPSMGSTSRHLILSVSVAAALFGPGCYEVGVVGLPGPPKPLVLFEGDAPVEVTDYLTMLLFTDVDPALVVVRGSENEVFGPCEHRDAPLAWLADSPSVVALQFATSALRDTNRRTPDVSKVCVAVVPSCETAPPCGRLDDEFVVSSESSCTKGADLGLVFSYYEWSGTAWRTVTGTATDGIRCRLALKLDP